MNSSGICSQQRDKEAKAFKSFLKVCLICSAGLHAAGLAWVVSQQWGRSPGAQTQAIEITVIPAPATQATSKPAAANTGKPSLTERGAIEYLPFGDTGLSASSLQATTPTTASGSDVVSSTGLLTNEKGSLGTTTAQPDEPPASDRFNRSDAQPIASASPPSPADSQPLVPPKPAVEPQPPSSPTFTKLPALEAALSSISGPKGNAAADRTSTAVSSFTSIPSLDGVSALNRAGSSNTAQSSTPANQQHPDSNPNGWLANLKDSLAGFLSGTSGGNSSFSGSRGSAGLPLGSSVSAGVATRSAGSSGNSGSPSAYGAGANGLGKPQSVSLSQAWGSILGNSGNASQRPTCVNCPDLPYPAWAQALGYTGTVKATANVDEHGNIINIKVVDSSGHESLDRSTIEGVKKWLLNSNKGGYHNVTISTTYRKGGAAVSVEDGSPRAANSPQDRGSVPTTNPSFPPPAPSSHRGETSVYDLEPKLAPQQEPSSREATADRPSAPAAPPQPAIAEPPPPQSVPVPPDPASEENSTPGVANIESAVSPASDSKPSTTP